MAGDLKNLSSEEYRLQNYRHQLQQRNDVEIREIEQKHLDQVQRLQEDEAQARGELHQAYDLKISQEAESLGEKLDEIRQANQEKVAAEQRVGEQELAQVKTLQQQRLDEYRKNSDLQLEKIRRQYQSSAEALHDKSRRYADHEKEVNKS